MTHSFMGLVGYYHHFVRYFSRVAHFITSIHKKGNLFIWLEKYEVTFQALKELLTSAPILIMPNPTLDFVVCIDA